MAPETERKRPDWQPMVGVLSFVTAVLSVAIFVTTGGWPTDLDVWGVILFAVLGVVIIGDARRTPTD